MSHIVTIQCEVRDPVAVRAACRRLALAEPQVETVQLFSGRRTGLAVRLAGWRYPVVCETQSGRVHFDNFGGHWGDKRELDRFLQAYAVEKAKLLARRQGYHTSEEQLADGSIRLQIRLGSG